MVATVPPKTVSGMIRPLQVATTKNKWRPSSLSYYYTNSGELMYVRGTNTTVEGHDRFMVANRDGQLISRRDGKKLQDYYYSNGQVLGTAGTLLTPGKADFASYFSSNVQSQGEMALTSLGTYTVQSGDTLQSIAGKLWGDCSLWYVLADANGIESNSLLTDGVQLSIPSVNETLHNTSSTFKTYNASSIIGANEAQPIAPPAPSQCGAMLVTLVVVIVAAVVTYGASTAFTGTAAGVSSVGTAGTAGLGAAASGTAATGLGTVGGAIAGATAGAMASSAAGQLVGMAIGQQNGFDLGAVFKAGARGALSAGVGAIAGSIVGTSTEIGAIASRSALQAGGNYLVNRAMTGEGGFSWAGIAANVAGSVAGHYAGAQIVGDGTDANRLLMRDMTSNFAGGWAENSARQWLGIGGKREWSDIAIDAFGNAVGNSIAGSYQAAADAISEASILAKLESETGYSIDQLKQYGTLSKNAYEKNGAPDGWNRISDDEALLKEIGLKKSDFENEGSGFYSALYKSEENGEFVLAFRGTQDIKDWRNNYQQGVGGESAQYKAAVVLVNKLNVKLDADYTITGHSLGGGLASVAALAARHKAVTFNAAGIHPKTIERYDRSHANEQIKALRIDGELLTGVQESGISDIVGFALTPIKWAKDLVTLIDTGKGDFTPILAFGAIGSKFTLPAVDLQGVTMARIKSFNPMISLDLHGMNYVVRSLNFIGNSRGY